MLVVIGGGLAGTSAAITAAKAGIAVILLEAGTYPRHKVCGEFLSPEAAGYLDELGVLASIHAENPSTLTRTRITSPDGGCWEGDLPGVGIGISRYKLDQLLADQARSVGVQVVTNTTVSGVTGSLSEGFTVETRTGSIRARAVIAAYGKRAALDRTLNRAFMRQPQPYIGLKAHFRGDVPPNRVDLHAFPGGYCGISGIEGGLINVCMLARVEVFKHCDSIPAFITWIQTQNPHLRRFFAGVQQDTDWLSISQIPFNNKSAVEGDILMAGDSAGMIAPLAGDGMSIALHSGKIAAEYVRRYLEGEIAADTLKASYATVWRKHFDGRIRLGRFLQASIFKPPILSFGLHLMNAAPALGQYFIRQTREVKRG